MSMKTGLFMSSRLPVVGIPCDYRIYNNYPFHMVPDKYMTALRECARALPVLVPVLPDPIPPAELLASLDGILFPGSPSGVAPRHYGAVPVPDPDIEDEFRDATTLPLIRAAAAAGVPVLGICRGIQELNVALGGTLHQRLHRVEGRHDHRSKPEAPLDEQYAPAHEVYVQEGGLLARLTNHRTFHVNSLHWQGIDCIAPALRAEALAPDGTIEAVSLKEPKGFLLGTQWHPEWRWWENPQSRAIFGAFGEALRQSRTS